MKWTVLIDNRTADRAQEMSEERAQNHVCLNFGETSRNSNNVETEHGLSVLLVTDRHSILLDTGASDMLIRNAERLGIDLNAIDYVFVSHGHRDHAGGLKHLLELNHRAKVIVSSDAINGKFFSKRGRLHSITTEWPEITEGRLLVVDENCEIADGVHIIAHIPQIHHLPNGNQNLFMETDEGHIVPDDFRHELVLYVDGLLFTGCAHSGLENILSACRWPIHTVVGGFHLIDGYESEDELTALAKRLKANYAKTHFYTSHCTGDRAFTILQSVMGSQLHSFHCGFNNVEPSPIDE